MNARVGDYLYAYEYVKSAELGFLTASAADFDARYAEGKRRGWFGDVVYDHVRGVRDGTARALVEPGYILVAFWQDFDWTQSHTTRVEEYRELPAAIARAEELVATERATGSSNVELWDVYVVRVRVQFGER